MAKKVAHAGVSAVFVACVASAFGAGAALIDPTAAEYHFNKVQTQQAAQWDITQCTLNHARRNVIFVIIRGGVAAQEAAYT